MTSRFRSAHGAAGVFLLATIGAGCKSSNMEPTRLSNTGQYVIGWSRLSTTCAPRALPSPLGTDATQYAQVPQSPSSFQTSAQIQQHADSISVNALDASGKSINATALTGSLGGPTDPVFLSRSSSQVEGVRADGHAFYVSETATDTGMFYYAVRTPPGQGTQISFLASGADVFVFRDGGPAGGVFTTCTVIEKLTGSNVSN